MPQNFLRVPLTCLFEDVVDKALAPERVCFGFSSLVAAFTYGYMPTQDSLEQTSSTFTAETSSLCVCMFSSPSLCESTSMVNGGTVVTFHLAW